jgi:hypothetical protein
MKTKLLCALAALAGAALVWGCTNQGGAKGMSAAQMSAIGAPAGAVEGKVPETAANFMLTDQNLEAHELYRLADAPAVVLITQGDGCPIVRNMGPAIKALRDEFAPKGVEFMMLNSNRQDTREAVQAEAKEFGYDLPVLLDSTQLTGEQLGVNRTAEVYVIDPKTWKIAYHGALDDRVTYERQTAKAKRHYAADALNAVLAGQPVPVARTQSQGCLIDFPGRDKAAEFANISYSKQIAPILEAKCVACHQEGGIGPWAMTNYDMVKGFSPMIREVIRTDRMPPWRADPHVGVFNNDMSLSAEQKRLIVHWIDAGAPRGDGPDPLGAVRRVAPEWPLGKPDLVLNVPKFTIPATGIVDYQRPIAINPLKEGKWLRASTVKVGQRQGVHHVLTGYLATVPKDGKGLESRWGVSVGGYAVGAESLISPENVGAYLPAGGAVGFQMHYTPFGKEVVDDTKIGLYFYHKKPQLVMHNTVIADFTIELPPNDAHHTELAYLAVPKDMLLYGAFPHAHYRGASSTFSIRYPDGTEKLLVALPKYDFNWQREYDFAEPVKVPAGSLLIARYVYDNSKRNPANPDPNKTVHWGDQSFEEMLYTAFRYRWTDETSDKLVNYDELMQQGRMFGMLDDNIDGKLDKSELRGQFGQMLAANYDKIDANHDGAIEANELQGAMALMRGNRRGGGGDGR